MGGVHGKTGSPARSRVEWVCACALGIVQTPTAVVTTLSRKTVLLINSVRVGFFTN